MTSTTLPDLSASVATDPTAAQTPSVNIGTRRSALAQIQARWVEQQLKRAHPERNYNICAVLAQGDKDKVTPLQQLSQGENAKSLWTGELEGMLEQGELDIIVHCLKDMPTQLPENLALAAILAREDPRDALIVSPRLPKGTVLAALPEDATIGTSSIRRSAQLRRQYPSLQFKDLRGNLGTRLGKLDAEDSPYSAIILAAAGLKRMGLEDRISQYLSGDNGGMLHAVGQGALAIEIRKDDQVIKSIVDGIKCERTTRACSAERALLRALEGGCSVPIGVETTWQGGRGVAIGAEPACDYDKDGQPVQSNESDLDQEELILKTVVVSVDGQDSVEYSAQRRVRSVDEAEAFGKDIARILLEKGADKILAKISKEKQWAAQKQLEAVTATS